MNAVCPLSRETDAEPFDEGAWPAARTLEVVRLERGTITACEDAVVEEVPVALVYNGISHAVMLASPRELKDLALGFSLSEGILSSPRELYDIELAGSDAGIEVRMEIASGRFVALRERRRTLAGRTGCGLCGVESLAAVATPRRVIPAGPRVVPGAIARALEALPRMQSLRETTGAVHAAAWVRHDGTLLAVREDVGRHNALDKLIGWMTASQQPVQEGFALVSSRASYEMVQKSATAGITALVAVSAPTAMAVRAAEESGVALAGFARPGRLVIYARPDRFETTS